MADRYGFAGRVYDAVSLERVLYRRPRERLLVLLGPQPGATVVDVGCGTGLNLAGLRTVVGAGGLVVGIDASASMLESARRRVRRAGWCDVRLLHGDAMSLGDVLRAAGIDTAAVEAIVATFVLSMLPDDDAVWSVVDQAAARHPVRVAIADLGPPDDAPLLARPLLQGLTKFGGGDPGRRPWDRLLARDHLAVHEVHLGGHVHLAVGDI